MEYGVLSKQGDVIFEAEIKRRKLVNQKVKNLSVFEGFFYGGKGTRTSIENIICDSNAFRKEYLGIELEIR